MPQAADLEDEISKQGKATAIADLRAVEASGVRFAKRIQPFANAFLAELNGNSEGAMKA
jgi:hypothetical protein